VARNVKTVAALSSPDIAASRLGTSEAPTAAPRLTRLRLAFLALRPYVPARLYPALYRLYAGYMELFGRATGWRDRRYAEQIGVPYLPPAQLRYRVSGSTDVRSFLQVGMRNCEDVVAAVTRAGRRMDSFENILDFGCGCARTLLWLAQRNGSATLYGSDIDAHAISWCQREAPFARFDVNQPSPPLAYEAETFDMIYALSVFTHFGEQAQYDWLSELLRVARPGALLVLSVHGRNYFEHLPARYRREMEQRGFLFLNDNAYHTEEYIRDHWSQYTELVEIAPGGLSGHQDLIVLKKPP